MRPEELSQVLEKLRQFAEKIVETRSYTQEVEQVKILEEMIKEQLIHENPRPATRPPR